MRSASVNFIGKWIFTGSNQTLSFTSFFGSRIWAIITCSSGLYLFWHIESNWCCTVYCSLELQCDFAVFSRAEPQSTPVRVTPAPYFIHYLSALLIVDRPPPCHRTAQYPVTLSHQIVHLIGTSQRLLNTHTTECRPRIVLNEVSMLTVKTTLLTLRSFWRFDRFYLCSYNKEWTRPSCWLWHLLSFRWNHGEIYDVANLNKLQLTAFFWGGRFCHGFWRSDISLYTRYTDKSAIL